MLRFFFWTLLIANALLLAFNFGYLGSWSMDTHEPQRLRNQYRPDQLQLVSANVATAVLVGTTEKNPDLIACLEIGNFLQGDVAKIEDKLKQLSLGDRQTRINIQDVATHIVFIPSLGSKEGADKKAGELHRLGINDFYVVQDQSSLRWGISLGVFKTEDAAKAHLADLNSKGVRTARIGARSITTNKFAYQLHALNGEEKARLDNIKTEFPNQDVRDCKSTPYSKS